jgi:hypothetical protein
MMAFDEVETGSEVMDSVGLSTLAAIVISRKFNAEFGISKCGFPFDFDRSAIFAQGRLSNHCAALQSIRMTAFLLWRSLETGLRSQ